MTAEEGRKIRTISSDIVAGGTVLRAGFGLDLRKIKETA
jgi:hypothetical protein